MYVGRRRSVRYTKYVHRSPFHGRRSDNSCPRRWHRKSIIRPITLDRISGTDFPVVRSLRTRDGGRSVRERRHTSDRSAFSIPRLSRTGSARCTGFRTCIHVRPRANSSGPSLPRNDARRVSKKRNASKTRNPTAANTRHLSFYQLPLYLCYLMQQVSPLYQLPTGANRAQLPYSVVPTVTLRVIRRAFSTLRRGFHLGRRRRFGLLSRARARARDKNAIVEWRRIRRHTFGQKENHCRRSVTTRTFDVTGKGRLRPRLFPRKSIEN